MSKRKTEDQQNADNWMQGVTIRSVKRSDLEGLEWEGEYIRFRNIYRETFQRMRRGAAKMWAADLKDAGLIGQVFIQFYPKNRFNRDGEKQAYIHAVRVRTDYRGCGLGTELMAVAEKDLISRNIREVTLNVAKDNPGALRFYKRLGYQLVGETEGRWWYHDHTNKLQEVVEPSWRLLKNL